MNKTFRYSILCVALLAVGQNTLRAEEKSGAASPPLTREEAVLVSVTASVEAIDLASREVTLKGPLGNTVTFTVDKRVKRLDEVKVGDLVRADYYVSVAAELRKPTAAEKKNPIMVLQGVGKAPPGTSPAAGGLRRFKVVTTIEGLDLPNQMVTVKGPRGNSLTARAANPANLAKMKIGDTIVIIYTEALAISLEKTEKKSAN